MTRTSGPANRLYLFATALACLVGGAGALCTPADREAMRKMDEILAADGRRILFVSDAAGTQDIYKVNEDGSDPVVVKATPQDEKWPCWTTFRSRIAFTRAGRVFSMWGDGTDDKALDSGSTDDSLACSPDGTQLAFSRSEGRKVSIWTMDSKGNGLRRISDGPGIDDAPSFSPGGDRIAFMSDRDGAMSIYTMNIDGTDVRRVSTGSGRKGHSSPAWSLTDRILYWNEDGTGPASYVSVKPDGTDPQSIGVARIGGTVAWSPDGSHFLFVAMEGGLPDLWLKDVGSGAPVQFIKGRPARNLMPSWSKTFVAGTPAASVR